MKANQINGSRKICGSMKTWRTKQNSVNLRKCWKMIKMRKPSQYIHKKELRSIGKTQVMHRSLDKYLKLTKSIDLKHDLINVFFRAFWLVHCWLHSKRFVVSLLFLDIGRVLLDRSWFAWCLMDAVRLETGRRPGWRRPSRRRHRRRWRHRRRRLGRIPFASGRFDPKPLDAPALFHPIACLALRSD